MPVSLSFANAGALLVTLTSIGLIALLPYACARKTVDTTPEPANVSSKVARTVTSSAAASALGDQAIAEVAERVLPAVVSVASTRAAKLETPGFPFDERFFRRFFGPGAPAPFPAPPGEAPLEHGLGSGVIVGKDTILTNAHVIAGATELEVTALGRRKLKTEIVGADPESDLAVLKIVGDTSKLSSLEFADSAELRLGEIVLAVGHPFGVGETVTMGIVSAKGRTDLGIEAYEDFIQTDAAINPGNSGGALVDLRGKLVGVPTAILSRSGGYMGVGFAIPSNMAQPITRSLIEHGRVVRGFLGVTIQNLDSDLAKAFKLSGTDGVLIADVADGSPADKAGVQRGDVLLSVDGQKVLTTGQLRNLIAGAGVGRKVALEILRKSEKKTLSVTLGELPGSKSGAADSGPAVSKPAAGLDVEPLAPARRKELGVPADVPQGVAVTGVEPGGPAARAGLRPGDVLLELDGKPITSPARLKELWNQSKGKVAALAWRENRTFYVVLEH